jgi:serine O-acetyltransferase
MTITTHTEVFADTLSQLTDLSGEEKRADYQHPLPCWTETGKLLEDLRSLLLMNLDPSDAEERLTRAIQILQSQSEICNPKSSTSSSTHRVCEEFLAQLPGMRRTLQEDIKTALQSDPAVTSRDEVVLCYPGLKALTYYRIARALHKLDVPLLPRLMTEIGHSLTGIDIHPGAEIGSGFFIDHGTGVVIGATCVIGNDVKIYQGVTLGARSFPKSVDGQIIKGIARHPVIGDGVTIYAGATILGRVHIGANSVIGGNVWITTDVPAGSHMRQRYPRSDS